MPASAHNPSRGFPSAIFIIRHGEKPADPSPPVSVRPPPAPSPPFGVDVDGNQNPHSLLPRGWQRSGALTPLFAPADGAPPTGVDVPSALFSPDYGNLNKTAAHRTYQTIQGIALRLGLSIQAPCLLNDEQSLITTALGLRNDVVLICWEHHRIPALAAAIPTVPNTMIPATWPGDRFDVIWCFTRSPGDDPALYRFSQIPQQLLNGDTDTIISVT